MPESQGDDSDYALLKIMKLKQICNFHKLSIMKIEVSLRLESSVLYNLFQYRNKDCESLWLIKH